MNKRSLYDCMEARYPIDRLGYIYCRKGYSLGNGRMSGLWVDRNNPLIITACQNCPDFVSMDDDSKVKD